LKNFILTTYFNIYLILILK